MSSTDAIQAVCRRRASAHRPRPPLRHTCDIIPDRPGQVPGTLEAMIRRDRLMLGMATLLAVAAGCSAGDDRPGGPSAAPPAGPTRVIMLGDSVAAGQALPLNAALGAAGVEFHSMASDGGGTVVGPVSEKLWQTLPERLAGARPSTVIYQITTYDWGSEQEQQAAYERLATTVARSGARLVFVTMPPIKPDDFYQPHMDELANAAGAARAVGAGTVVLDAAEVWGATYQRTRDGVADRSSDGIHTCPQGAARFTSWLLRELAELYPGFRPPAPATWANSGWSGDRRFIGC